MEVTVLGCNGLYPANGINTSGYLIRANQDNIVFDMGSGVFSELKQIMRPEKVSAIFISHLHHDHIADLGVYNYYLEALSRSGQFSGKIKLLIAKDESAVYRLIEGLNYFEIVNVSDGETFGLNSLTFSFYKTAHPAYTLGTTLFDGQKTLGYTADGNLCDNLTQIIEKSDLCVCHAPFSNEEWSSLKAHVSAKIACKIAKEKGTKIVISHLLPDRDNSSVIEEGLKEDPNALFAMQGKTYNVG